MRVATALRCVPPSRGWTNPLTMTATDRRRASSLVSCAKCGGTFIFDCVACAGGRCARALFVALIFLESTTREPPSSCAHETKPWARPPPPRCRGHPPPPTTRDAQQSTGPVARHRSPRGMQSFILATEGGGWWPRPVVFVLVGWLAGSQPGWWRRRQWRRWGQR